MAAITELEQSHPRPTAVEVRDGKLWVTLVDGRVIGTPLDWYMPLTYATPAELANYQLSGEGIHWPDLDEDLGVEDMLMGVRPRYPWTPEQWRARANAVREVTEHFGPDATIITPIDMTDPLDAVVTAHEIAKEYGLTIGAVYKAVERGAIEARRAHKTYLIRLRDAEAVWGGKRDRRKAS